MQACAVEGWAAPGGKNPFASEHILWRRKPGMLIVAVLQRENQVLKPVVQVSWIVRKLIQARQRARRLRNFPDDGVLPVDEMILGPGQSAFLLVRLHPRRIESCQVRRRNCIPV